MKNYSKLLTLFVLSILFSLISFRNAYAYLDPGSGSFFLQLIIATVLGGLFTIKLFWTKIKSFFRKIFSKKNK